MWWIWERYSGGDWRRLRSFTPRQPIPPDGLRLADHRGKLRFYLPEPLTPDDFPEDVEALYDPGPVVWSFESIRRS